LTSRALTRIRAALISIIY
jgi:ATP-binding cassette subfamily C (CFTR/MRP) protein 1